MTKRIGVVRGGPSSEYEVSLKTGGSVLKHLPEHYQARDILIDKEGRWYLEGVPTLPERVARQVDVIFNALHGEYGEDGRVQNLLDQLRVPYTGSGTFASALGMNKPMSKEVFSRAGLKVPRGFTLKRDDAPDLSRYVHSKMGPPWVIKPADRGSSMGLSLARTFPELARGLEEAFRYSTRVLVEEYLRGREATCGVLERFRDREHYALPAIEIRRPQSKPIWDYQDKYSGETEEICPAPFSDEEKRMVEEMATRAHASLGLRHYSRADFILTPKGVYLLEVNTLPGLTEHSLLPKSINAVGCSYPDFLDHLIKLALESW